LALAYYNDQPAAASILISYNKLIYSYISATDYIAIKESHASNLLRYEIIKYAKQIGCDYHDMGGIPFSSDQSIETHGVYMFKKSFGGVRNEYDIGNFVIKKCRYWIIWKLMKNQHHPIIRLGYKLLKGNSTF
jgi:lipid II:glycine glycyltransferase (peptidoglycan interpeptide bridge formation enzyme)